MIGFQIDFLAIDGFGALIFARANHIQSLTLLFFLDDLITRGKIFNCHCIDQNTDIAFWQALEKDGFFYQFLDCVGGWLIFFNNPRCEVFLFPIKLPIDLCTDSLPTGSILFLILFQLGLESFVCFFFLLLVLAFLRIRFVSRSFFLFYDVETITDQLVHVVERKLREIGGPFPDDFLHQGREKGGNNGS